MSANVDPIPPQIPTTPVDLQPPSSSQLQLSLSTLGTEGYKSNVLAGTPASVAQRPVRGRRALVLEDSPSGASSHGGPVLASPPMPRRLVRATRALVTVMDSPCSERSMRIASLGGQSGGEVATLHAVARSGTAEHAASTALLQLGSANLVAGPIAVRAYLHLNCVCDNYLIINQIESDMSVTKMACSIIYFN